MALHVYIEYCKVKYSSPSYIYFELLMACVTTYYAANKICLYVLCMLSLDNYIYVRVY